MDSRLYSAGYLAIPIKANLESSLNPQPNWMVIDNIFGRLEATLPVLGNTVCSQSAYKLSFREILPANEELGRMEEMRELVYENTNQPVPVTIVPALASYQGLQAYTTEVNQLLALFQFRGVLAGFTLEIDTDVLEEILTPTE